MDIGDQIETTYMALQETFSVTDSINTHTIITDIQTNLKRLIDIYNFFLNKRKVDYTDEINNMTDILTNFNKSIQSVSFTDEKGLNKVRETAENAFYNYHNGDYHLKHLRKGRGGGRRMRYRSRKMKKHKKSKSHKKIKRTKRRRY